MVANNTQIILLKLLKQIVPKARYVWQLTGTRTAIENKDKLQNILGQRVILTKYYADISHVRICSKRLWKIMCRLLNKHNKTNLV